MWIVGWVGSSPRSGAQLSDVGRSCPVWVWAGRGPRRQPSFTIRKHFGWHHLPCPVLTLRGDRQWHREGTFSAVLQLLLRSGSRPGDEPHPEWAGVQWQPNVCSEQSREGCRMEAERPIVPGFVAVWLAQRQLWHRRQFCSCKFRLFEIGE